jgi:hypothetical protein
MKDLKFMIFSIAVVILLGGRCLFAAEPTILNGKWKLNVKESDDMREKFQQAMKDQEGAKGHHHRQAVAPGGGFGQGNREMHGEMSNIFQPPDSMTITYQAPELKITDSTGKERKYFTDGRKTVEEARGRKRTFISRWEDDSLIVESDSPDGGTMTQTYYLSPEGNKLYVKLRMQPMMLDHAITVVRVFDADRSETQTK